jgi:osomolarity two-component system, sensor histidine kinase NIK1
MSAPETTAALAGILSNLAKHHDPPVDASFNGQALTNGAKSTLIALPGPDCPEKETLERELAALTARIQYLEAKANVIDNHTFPITPGEPGAVTSPYLYETDVEEPVISNGEAQAAERRGSQKEQKAAWFNTWLSAKASPKGEPQTPTAALTEEQLSYLRDHLNKQAEQIRNQRTHIDNLSAEVNRQLKNQDIAFGHGIEDIGALKRELGKHQQANLAFQKALREIGNIVTAVAMGDLSKKVLIHAKEMDPEITTFKRTINKMVDQLQDFASQVTFLAKEVGTEGRLGGQANLPGVDGIWAELTDSGMLFPDLVRRVL